MAKLQVFLLFGKSFIYFKCETLTEIITIQPHDTQIKYKADH